MSRYSFHRRGLLPTVALWGALLSLGQGLVAQTAESVLQDGTPVRLRLSRNLSSAEAREGETVDFEVLEEVRVGGSVVIQKGAVALATVTMAQAKRSMGRAGKLDVSIDHVRMANGEKAALRSVKQAQGGGNTGKMTGAVVATSIIFFPAAPLFLFVKGKDVTIPKGTEITAYVNGDTRLASPAPAATLMARAIAPDGPALTNGSVLDLKKAGLSDEIIVAKIRASRGDYHLETDDLIALKKAGISDAAIRAMLEAAR